MNILFVDPDIMKKAQCGSMTKSFIQSIPMIRKTSNKYKELITIGPLILRIIVECVLVSFEKKYIGANQVLLLNHDIVD